MALPLGWVGGTAPGMPNVETTMAKRIYGSGSVSRRKDGRFQAQVMREGHRITKYGKTEKEAYANLQRALDDLKQGKTVRGLKQTVEQYLTHWLEDSRRLKIKPGTLRNYRIILRVYLLPEFGHVRLDQMSREQIQSFCTELFDEGISPAYIKQIHMLFSSALQEAVDDGILARNPCDRVTLPRQEQYKARFLTLEEGRRLIAAAKGHRLWLFLLVMLTTGARRGELTGLRWSDLDLKNGELYIRRTVTRLPGMGFVEGSPKSASSMRKVRLSQPVLDALEDQKRYIDDLRVRAGACWRENNLVFPNKSGGYLDRWVIRCQFKQIWSEAGLSYLRFHDLRHSAATLLLAAGVNIKVVQEMLGHSNARTTLQMYGHVLPDMQKDAIDKLNGMFG